MRLFKYVIILLFFLNCSSTTNNSEAIKNEIKLVLDNQVESWNNNDIPGFMMGYFKSEEITYTSGGVITRGYESLEKRYLNNYGETDLGTLSFNNLEITPLNNDAAFVLGFYHLKKGEELSEGVFTLVFKRTPEGFKMIHDHTSSIPK